MSDKKGIEFIEGDTLFGKLRPYLKNWLFADFIGIAVGDFWVLRPSGADGGFIHYLIQADDFQTIANLSVGTKMPRSDWSIVSETMFSLPTIEEQIAIGEFFVNMDMQITVQSKKLERLKQLKVAYLQKMFI